MALHAIRAPMQWDHSLNIVIVDDQTSARTMLRHILEDIGPELQVHRFRRPAGGAGLVREQSARPAAARLPHAGHGRAGIRPAIPPPADASRRADRAGDRGRRRAVRQAALEAGVIDFLVKPVRPRELRARCRNLLHLRQQAESGETARPLAGTATAVQHARGRGARTRDAVAAGQRDRIPRRRHQRLPRAHGAHRRPDRRRPRPARRRSAR